MVEEKCVLSNCQWEQDEFTPCSSCKGKNAKMVDMQRQEWKKVKNAKMLVLQRQECKQMQIWSSCKGARVYPNLATVVVSFQVQRLDETHLWDDCFEGVNQVVTT